MAYLPSDFHLPVVSNELVDRYLLDAWTLALLAERRLYNNRMREAGQGRAVQLSYLLNAPEESCLLYGNSDPKEEGMGGHIA